MEQALEELRCEAAEAAEALEELRCEAAEAAEALEELRCEAAEAERMEGAAARAEASGLEQQHDALRVEISTPSARARRGRGWQARAAHASRAWTATGR